MLERPAGVYEARLAALLAHSLPPDRAYDPDYADELFSRAAPISIRLS